MRIPAPALIFAIALSMSLAHAAQPAPGAKPVPAAASAPVSADTVDQKKIHAEYGDGNFETVTQILEDYRARHDHYRVADSVLVAKYLGVIYASNPNTREKGKYWLYKMLQMDPAQDLVDLYVGEEVQGTFEKVRQEFIVRRNYRGINDTRLNKAVADGEPAKIDTVIRKDTVMMHEDNYLTPIVSPIASGIKGGYDEVKGGIKAGIQAGYVPIEEEHKPDDSRLTGNINIGAGLKFLDATSKDNWDNTAGFTDETELRLATDLRQGKWPINIAFDFTYAYAPEVYQDLSGDGHGLAQQFINTYEMNAGVRKIFDFRLYTVRPFFGGGLGYTITQWDLKSDNYDESTQKGHPGIWLNGGVYWELDKHFNIGIDWMYSWSKIHIYKTLNHGGHHLNMLVGFHY